MEKTEKDDCLSQTTTITNTLGIHARPAAKISQIAETAKQNIWLSTGKSKVDAGSIIDILTLGACQGTKIVIEAETFEDIKILKSICTLIESGFGEVK